MRVHEKSEFLDLLYEAAYDPAAWAPAFQRLADILGSNSAWLSEHNVYEGTGGSADDPMFGVHPEYMQRYFDYFWTRNPIALTGDPAGFLREWKLLVHTDADCVARDELVRTEFYNDYLRPQRVGDIMIMRLARMGDSIAVLNLSRDERHGRYDQAEMEWARAHHADIIRTYRLSKKIGADRKRRQGVEALLDLSPNGFFLLDASGTIRHANLAGERLLAEAGAFSVVHGKLRAAQPSASKQLEALIAIAASPDADVRRGGSVALLSPRSALPLSVVVMPIPSGERFAPIQSGLSVCVCVTDLAAEMRLPRGPLHSVFGLTDAEIRVAQALFEGMSLQDIAVRFGISPNTVRVQLSSIFDKTSTNRQSELIAMLSRLSHARPS
jgi:DNA-binding CsgD family transcriptional regulator/PAS domain-containing protein